MEENKSDLLYNTLVCNFEGILNGLVKATDCRIKNDTLKYEDSYILDEIKKAKENSLVKIENLRTELIKILKEGEYQAISYLLKQHKNDGGKDTQKLKKLTLSYDLTKDNLDAINYHLMFILRYLLNKKDYDFLDRIKDIGTDNMKIIFFLERKDMKDEFFIRDIKIIKKFQ